MLKRGCVVISAAGKDKGLVMAVLENTLQGVIVSDGRERLLQHPKRKNIRHLTDTCFTVEESSMATNRELRRALFSIKRTLNQ